MKKFIILISTVFLYTSAFSQAYKLDPVGLDVYGEPLDLLLPNLRVINVSDKDVYMFVHRIVRDIPEDWKSCFCYPECTSPTRDTITFKLNAWDTVEVRPNFGTSEVPNTGRVVVTINRVGNETIMDTITFTGSTIPDEETGVSTTSSGGFKVYLNSANELIWQKTGGSNDYTVQLFNLTGQKVSEKKMASHEGSMALGTVRTGVYLFSIIDSNGIATSKKILKTN